MYRKPVIINDVTYRIRGLYTSLIFTQRFDVLAVNGPDGKLRLDGARQASNDLIQVAHDSFVAIIIPNNYFIDELGMRELDNDLPNVFMTVHMPGCDYRRDRCSFYRYISRIERREWVSTI